MKNNKKEKVTILDVAKETRVSKSTVSLVLTQSEKVSNKSKERVLKTNTSDYHGWIAGFNSVLNLRSILDTKPIIQAQTHRQGGKEAFNKLFIVLTNIKAVICYSDIVAYGAIEAMRQHSLIPSKDIKVVGFNDLTDSGLMQPTLSSIWIDLYDIGKRVNQSLNAILNNSQPAVGTLVDVSIQIRESSL
jgi:LacI family transcriptional regulator